MNSLQGASYAGLAFTSWELCITLDDEVELMWRPRRKVHIVQLLYFFMRYFPLLLQIANTVLAGILEAHYPVSTELCRGWLAYQAISVFALLAAVDMILMIRIYAFYNQKRWIAILLVILFGFRIVLSATSAALTVPYQTFNAACLSDFVPTIVTYFFLFGELVLQGVILGLTVVKHIAAVRAGWGRTPIVSLLSRDGATTFTVITGVIIGTILYARFGYRHESAHYVFPAFVSIMSCVGCRLVISMQRLVAPLVPQHQDHGARRSRSRFSHSSDPETLASNQFTTIIESLWTGGSVSSVSSALSSYPTLPGAFIPPVVARLEARHPSVGSLSMGMGS